MLILIIATCAAISFYRKAKSLGLHSVRPTLFPIVAATVVITAGVIGSYLFAYAHTASGTSEGAQKAITLSLDLFLIIIYLMVIKRYWDVLIAVDDLRKKDEH